MKHETERLLRELERLATFQGQKNCQQVVEVTPRLAQMILDRLTNLENTAIFLAKEAAHEREKSKAS